MSNCADCAKEIATKEEKSYFVKAIHPHLHFCKLCLNERLRSDGVGSRKGIEAGDPFAKTKLNTLSKMRNRKT